MAQLHRAEADFLAAGAKVLLVGMGSVEQSAAFLREFDLPFDMVCDPERQLYKIFGLKSASPLSFLKPTLAFKGLAAVAGGHGVGFPVGDVRQMSGVFIVDSGGRIVFTHFAKDPSDNPAPATLIHILKPLAEAE